MRVIRVARNETMVETRTFLGLRVGESNYSRAYQARNGLRPSTVGVLLSHAWAFEPLEMVPFGGLAGHGPHKVVDCNDN